MTNRSYEELADAAERGELRRKPGTRRVGAEAMQIAREALMEATGADSPEEAASLALGRPRIGHGRGPSRQWRVRAGDELYEATERMAADEGITVSELVRRATAAYVMPQMCKPSGH